MAVSVCMASYNGQDFISKQVESVLIQLNENDELIVVDDCSQDSTVLLLESFHDPRIKIYQNPENTGHVKAFEKAISLAKNEYIFLADQDDIWVDGRLALMVDALSKPNVWLVASSFALIDEFDAHLDRENRRFIENTGYEYNKNLLKIIMGKLPYFGCAMAFKKEFKCILLPFPKFVEAHDLYLAIAANILKKNNHLSNITLYHRIHSSNKTPKKRRGLMKLLLSRIKMLLLMPIVLIRSRKC